MDYKELYEQFGLVEGQIGVNIDDEYVMLTIDEESATVSTLQENGWIRVNIFYPDGTEEELYRR